MKSAFIKGKSAIVKRTTTSTYKLPIRTLVIVTKASIVILVIIKKDGLSVLNMLVMLLSHSLRHAMLWSI